MNKSTEYLKRAMDELDKALEACESDEDVDDIALALLGTAAGTFRGSVGDGTTIADARLEFDAACEWAWADVEENIEPELDLAGTSAPGGTA